MQNLHEIDVRIKSTLLTCYPTLVDLLRYFCIKNTTENATNFSEILSKIIREHASAVRNIKCFMKYENLNDIDTSCLDIPEICGLLLCRYIGLMNVANCCDFCQHDCKACPVNPTVQHHKETVQHHEETVQHREETVTCIKSPCIRCGTDGYACPLQKLLHSVTVVKTLFELNKDCGISNVTYENFHTDNNTGFLKFLYCKTWESLWRRIHCAISFCLQYLNKKGFVQDDVLEDRNMDLRIALKKTKKELIFLFEDQIKQGFQYLTSSSININTIHKNQDFDYDVVALPPRNQAFPQSRNKFMPQQKNEELMELAPQSSSMGTTSSSPEFTNIDHNDSGNSADGDLQGATSADYSHDDDDETANSSGGNYSMATENVDEDDFSVTPHYTLTQLLPPTDYSSLLSIHQSSISPTQNSRLVLMRGLPGSGKTTKARKITSAGGIILSTDNFFLNEVGVFNFQVEKLGDAHLWNQEQTKQEMAKKTSPICIDNTNIQAWEMNPYALLARKFNYIIQIEEVDTEWAFKPKILAQKTSKSVSKSKLEQMKRKYEKDITIDAIFRAQKPERR